VATSDGPVGRSFTAERARPITLAVTAIPHARTSRRPKFFTSMLAQTAGMMR
jgi:hypothetical protein